MGSKANPLVSVIVPTRNRRDRLARCLHSVYMSDYQELEVVVVDDASQEPAEAALSKTFPTARFVRNESRRLLSCSRNAGAAASRGDYLFFLDDDNLIAADTVRILASSLGRSSKTAVSAPVVYYLSSPSTVWTSYISRSRFPGFYRLHTDVPRGEVPTFSFHNSFMVKRKVFEDLNGFDCANLPIRFGEVDFAHRTAAAGYAAVVNPLARAWHDLGWSLVHIDSTRSYYTERNRIIVLKRYFGRRDLTFYVICILPFISIYHLFHHTLSTTDGRVATAASFLRGTLDGLRFRARA